MRPTLADRLQDILDATGKVEHLTSGIDEVRFANDWIVRLAVERALEIVSEACRHVADELRESGSSVPWRRIFDFGNLLRHAYHNVDTGIVWRIATEDVPDLKAAVKRMEAKASG